MQNFVKAKLGNTFSAFKHKSYRYYYIGMGISLVGTWMQNIAQPWLAYRLTDSPFLLSIVGAMQFLPMMLFSVFSGVIIDKFEKKKLLYITQATSLIITLILSILVFTNQIQYWHILVLAFFLGLVNTIDMPMRHAFIIELVGKNDLMNAIALNSSLFNLARIIGPTIAGLVMGWFGIGACFLINSISFAAVLISLVFVKPIKIEKTHEIELKNIKAEIKEGLNYIFGKRSIVLLLLSIFIVCIFGMNFSIILPVLIHTVMHSSETGLGIMMSFMGLGSFFAAINVAAKSKSGPKEFFLQISPFVIAIIMIVTGFSEIFIFSCFLVGLLGFFLISFTATANTLVQILTDDDHRGRVMSFYTLVLVGSTPIGNVITGLLLDKFGILVGIRILGGSLAFFFFIYTIIKKRLDKK